MELGTAYGTAPLADGLALEGRIVYRDGGNRGTDGLSLLARLEAMLPSLGITRVASISALSPHAFPVFQSTRPNIFTHASTGQNTGSQGKGRSELQAKLSCLMEELESYCGEPKNARLIRGSYSYLRHQHALIYPSLLMHNVQRKRAATSEPLMWTPAWSIEHQAELWLPAEAVFFPFFPEDYQSRSYFPCSTNGLASGASYLEATIHGLYEVIERCYIAFYELGAATVTPIDDAVLDRFDREKTQRRSGRCLSPAHVCDRATRL
ncbi:YcaO-like family protein [Endomicrobium sp. AH-315-J14]|nr:YcaO-like family protein [Endomicrobium sp. AH-315-J14]